MLIIKLYCLYLSADDDRKLQAELEKSDKRIVETPKKQCDTLEEAKKRNSEILKVSLFEKNI